MKVSNKIEKTKSTKKNNHPFSNIGQNYSKLLQSLKNVSDKSDNSIYHKRNYSDIPKINENSPYIPINKPLSQEKQTPNSTKKLT